MFVQFQNTVTLELGGMRFFYRTVGQGANGLSGQALSEGWLEDVWPTMREVCHTSTKLVQFRVQNLHVPADLYTGITSGTFVGTASGSQMPAFVSWGFRTGQPGFRLRRGYKRVGYVSELDTAGDIPTVSAKGRLDTLASRLTQDVTEDLGGTSYTFQHVLLYQKFVGLDAKGNRKYEFYPTLAEQETHMIVSPTWAFDRITTQSSRKQGRGS